MNQERKNQQRFLVVDDHAAILEGTVPALNENYPEAQVLTAQNQHDAKQIAELYRPDLVILDLSIPEKFGFPATLEKGLELLQTLMNSSFAPNILILSTNVKPLIRLKPKISVYEGGFAAMDKSLPIANMLDLVSVVLRGSIYLPESVKSRPEFNAKWLEMLELKFKEGLTDKAIAKKMQISDRTIRNYWIRVQDTLNIADEPDKDLRVQIEIVARKMGLIE